MRRRGKKPPHVQSRWRGLGHTLRQMATFITLDSLSACKETEKKSCIRRREKVYPKKGWAIKQMIANDPVTKLRYRNMPCTFPPPTTAFHGFQSPSSRLAFSCYGHRNQRSGLGHLRLLLQMCTFGSRRCQLFA